MGSLRNASKIESNRRFLSKGSDLCSGCTSLSNSKLPTRIYVVDKAPEPKDKGKAPPQAKRLGFINGSREGVKRNRCNVHTVRSQVRTLELDTLFTTCTRG